MEIAIISLSLIVAGMLIERFFYQKEMNRQLGEATRAILSRNVNEFIAATTAEKVVGKAVENDIVDLSELSDKEHDKVIKNMVS
jgi:hypothetical protein